jgi:hypothetical protein
MGPIDYLRGPGVGQGGLRNPAVSAEHFEEILHLLPADLSTRPVDDLLNP